MNLTGFREEVASVKKIVLRLLAEDVRCRNDDKWLTYRVLRHYTKIYVPFEDFEKLPSFDTIRRLRQKIQNEEKICLPTEPDVVAKRQQRERQWRQYAVRE